jgi:hypothetical protein
LVTPPEKEATVAVISYQSGLRRTVGRQVRIVCR